MSKVCPACNAPLSASAVVCDYCLSSVVPKALSGTKRAELALEAEKLEALFRSARNRIILLLAGIIVAFMAAAWWLYHWLRSNTDLSALVLAALAVSIVLIALVAGSLVGNRIFYQRAIKIFETGAEPKLQALTVQFDVPRWQLEEILLNAIPRGSTLSHFLSDK